jgi:hypothetical protein
MGRSSIPGWGATVHTVTVGLVWRVGVSSSVGVVVMGSVGITMLHPRGVGDPELPRHLRWHRPHWKSPWGWCAEMVCHCAPFLWIWHLSPPPREKDSGGWGDRQWTLGCQNGWCCTEWGRRRSDCCRWQWKRVLVKEPSERVEEKHTANPHSWHTNYWCFLH